MNENKLREIIRELAKTIVSESSIDPGDGRLSDDEAHLMQKLADDAASEEELERELADDFKATHFSEDPENIEFLNWANRAASEMDSEGINKAEDIPFFEEDETGDSLNAWDYYRKGVSESEYAKLVDERIESAGMPNMNSLLVALDEELSESKEFEFDKFIKDIKKREENISNRKTELTENDGDSMLRLKQKLYQEDWRNSVKFKR